MTEVAHNTLVDERYRILERIGSGGMADVFRAEDTHLGRDVAIKVLHRRFAQDQEFVERFRREAKSAAGLQHPNVVAVFDRGEHEGTYYIAMEHLPGRTLKQIVEQEAPLSQERAIELGTQILDAAGFAHKRGVIHRDFKSHNVIVDEEGNAKVTDFGIARRGTSEITETGSIMGTAQYLSPEQAQGRAVTAASDLYSIGVILYEMLAGRLPFQGDSAVSVALKHLSEPPPPLSQLRPDVDPALESVVMAALAKDAAHRWQSAEEFRAALAAVGEHLVDGSGRRGQDTAAFVPVVAPLPDEAVAAAGGAGNGDATAPTAVAGEAPPPMTPHEAAIAEEERRRRWPWFALGLMTLALAALLAYLAASGILAGEKVEVPRVVGKQVLEARDRLERAGFEVREVRAPSPEEIGEVVDQDPDPGEEADEGSTVTLEVSSGPGEVRVPSVENLPERLAIKELQDADLKATVDREASETVREGLAIRTVPRGGAEVQRGTRVKLFVSSGPEQVTVPDVIGLSRESAEGRLRDEGLAVSVEEVESDEPEDEVVSQSPAGGTSVERGSAVTIEVSVGQPQVTVPDVTGLTPGAASARLRALGLVPSRQERSTTNPDEDGQVIDQRPGAGADVEEGRTVVIVVGALIQDE
ncbi:MAG TPA: Stk1 family PASTA domain-containing Ser/Thr kinase [Thermoleophilaceae bacterium]|nr:Stk1 family PASTA domain-containing Ser/Thr kinase [Thermoleophilaceae bacterium]